MSPPAISINHLSKCYQLGTIGRHTLADEVLYLWHKIRGRDPRHHMGLVGQTVAKPESPQGGGRGKDLFWALNDVSFDVEPGEVIGIIGRNGAGKSTLLKLLTRITEPTFGGAVIDGRVASLLEVGTGFHPELTGRENIYMNGTMLGMKKWEIDAKFDEIVAFSEIEQFIDTPVKRYSSGMYVRLAFSVAAHLEPEILLVDEVLAVGDAVFQRKCLGKMGDVAKTGRTILFVSHNMAAIQNLCHRAVWLQDGHLQQIGSVEEVIQAYMSKGREDADSFYFRADPPQDREAYIESMRLLDSDGKPAAMFGMGGGFEIEAVVAGVRNQGRYVFGAAFFDGLGGRICGMNSFDTGGLAFSMGGGERFRVVCRIPSMNLLPGLFRVDVVLQTADGRRLVDKAANAVTFEILGRDVYRTGRVPKGPGIMYLPCDWDVNPLQKG